MEKGDYLRLCPKRNVVAVSMDCPILCCQFLTPLLEIPRDKMSRTLIRHNYQHTLSKRPRSGRFVVDKRSGFLK